MRRLFLAALTVTLLAGAYALSGGQKPTSRSDLDIEIQERNPWTHLRLNQAPETFHFAVVSDRTGGHRARVFSRAVEQLNLMQPAFVISVGDLIEGYSKDPARVAEMWKEFQGYTSRLQMPFFYVPGNHDVANASQSKFWQERFGRRYYHFTYRDVLFLAVCSDDPNEDGSAPRLSKEQIAYFTRVLKDNPEPRWTIIAVHKPMWVYKNLDTNGWLELEKLLQGRNYTVFAGHLHRYQKYVRGGKNYYQLATTGGGSKMRGLRYGEFDQIAWVTMKKDGPVLANLMLDGIYPEDLRRPETAEEGVARLNRKATHPVRGSIHFEGAPAADALVVFYQIDAKNPKKVKYTRVGDALTEADGSFVASTYAAFDGLPTGEYAVTAVQRDDPYIRATKAPNRLPARYAEPSSSPLRVNIKSGSNEVNLNLMP